MTTSVDTMTFLWVSRKVAVTLPEGTVTVRGVDAAFGFELVSFTINPFDGAGPVSVIVPATAVADEPFTEVGEKESASSVGG